MDWLSTFWDNYHEWVFNALVVWAFATSLADHTYVGVYERVHKPVRTTLLLLFIATESWVALDGKPMFFLYVLLNFYGLFMLYVHKHLRKIPLGTIWLKRRDKWFGNKNKQTTIVEIQKGPKE